MKITKKKQIEDLQTVVAAQWRQINKLKLHLGRLVDIDWSDEQVNHDEASAISDSNKPKLKRLDQSVFDGLDEDITYAVVKSNGEGVASNKRLNARLGCDFCAVDLNAKFISLGQDFDTSNWQNSLIERDIARELLEVDLSSELTGSDLCRAMLERGDKCVVCFVAWDSDAEAIANKDIRLVHSLIPEEPNFHVGLEDCYFAVPINQQTGEPLTAADVGL